MKIKPHLIVAFLLFSFISISKIKAQEFNIGVKGGANYNIIDKLYHLGTDKGGGINLTPYEDFYYLADNKIGLTYGIFAKINYSKFFVQAEINASTFKNSYDLALKTTNWEASVVDIPLIVGYKFFEPVGVYAGPSLRITNDMTLEGVESPIAFTKTGLGVAAGFLFDLGIVDIDLRYVFGATKEKLQRIDMVRAEYGTNVAFLFSYHPNQFFVTLNFKILRLNAAEKRQRRSGSGWRNHKYL